MFEDVHLDNLFVVMDSIFKAPGLLMSMGSLTMLQGVLDGLPDGPSATKRVSETSGDAEEPPTKARAVPQPDWLSHLLSSQVVFSCLCVIFFFHWGCDWKC